MRRSLYSFIILMLVFSIACSSKPVPATSPTQSGGISGVDTAGFDITTRPQDDFFQYVSGKWVETTPIPSDKSNYGSFAIVRDQTEEQLHEIVTELSSREALAPGSETQKVRDFYQSYLKGSEGAFSSNELDDEIKEIDGIKSVADFWRVAGRLSKIDVSNVIGMGIFSDMKDPNTMAVYVSQGRLTLGDRDYYLKADERFVKGRALLSTYIDAVSTISKTEIDSKKLLEFETKVAQIQWPKEKRRDPKLRYNPMMIENLKKQLWYPILVDDGVPEQPKYIVMEPSFFNEIGKVVEETELVTLKQFLKFRLFNAFSSTLGRELFNARFDFSSKGLRGVQTPKPAWKRAISSLNYGLGEVLGKVYVERNFQPAATKKMNAMVANLRTAYQGSIEDLEWMGPETKKEAQDKLSKFNPKIAFPKQWKDYSGLNIGTSAVQNAKNISLFELQDAVAKLHQPVDKSEWKMPPQIVNAYYNPLWNEIVFPAAILQPPFFNLEADDAVNYGGIGAVIGHEIGHGFDDQGRKYDGDGVLRDWWTPQDTAKFEALKKKLASQYNAFKVIDGLTINGEYTSGENIGDLGGLSIAYKAYRVSLDGKEAPIIDGMTGDQRFFMGWALIWRVLQTDEDLKRRLATGVHSPNKARTNIILSNIDAFYEAFNVKEGDKMYLAPEKRVKIW